MFKKILLFDPIQSILDDVELSLMISGADIKVNSNKEVLSIDQMVSNFRPDAILVAAGLLKDRQDWKFGKVPVIYYGHNKTELKNGARYGLLTYGIIRNADALIHALSLEPHEYTENVSEALSDKGKAAQDEKSLENEKKRSDDPGNEDLPGVGKEPAKGLEKASESIKEEAGDKHTAANDKEEVADRQKAVKEKQSAAIQKENSDVPGNKTETKAQELAQLDDDYDDELSLLFAQEQAKARSEIWKKEETAPRADVKPSGSQEDTPEKKTVQDQEEPMAPERKEGTVTEAEEEFKKDVSGPSGHRKTKVITVYSAKGGVGKTAISSELATYLSLVSLGRRKLRVCIVDYNIDFGDVRSTLAITSEGYNLTYWAAEVAEFLDNGKKAKEITYTRDEIEKWMHQDENTGLYVLSAPLTNEDSAGIRTEALSIILDNIINYGEFDYVVCDTGNNTRNSTWIAITHADLVLLIMTQNVNTANCDMGFLNTVENAGYDLKNIRLVINMIMPKNITNISQEEVEDFFDFECIGKLSYNTDMIKATNIGKPLALQPDHKFTKEMQSIVSYVLQTDDFTTPKKEKKSLFGRLFRKKDKS